MTNVYIVVYYTYLVINIQNNVLSQSRIMHVLLHIAYSKNLKKYQVPIIMLYKCLRIIFDKKNLISKKLKLKIK